MDFVRVYILAEDFIPRLRLRPRNVIMAKARAFLLCVSAQKCSFYVPQLVPPGTAEVRISYGISVCLSVRLSRPGTDSMPDEIETPGLHRMIS